MPFEDCRDVMDFEMDDWVSEEEPVFTLWEARAIFGMYQLGAWES